MTIYEEALQNAFDRGLHVIENVPLESDAAAMIYDDVVLLSRMATYQQHVCILAEEIAHHDTNVGNILDQTDVANRKQERRARLLAFDRLIGLRGLIQCFLAGDRSTGTRSPNGWKSQKNSLRKRWKCTGENMEKENR